MGDSRFQTAVSALFALILSGCIAQNNCNLVGGSCFPGPTPTPTPYLDWTNVGASKWSDFQWVMQYESTKGVTATPSISFLSAPVTQTFDGAVLAPNGMVYMIPYGANMIMKVDPSTGTVTTFASGSVGTGWYPGGVLGFNGKIYAMPERFSTSILEISPSTDTIRLIDMSGMGIASGPCGRYFQGAAVGPDGKIYGIPACADKVLAYNPSNDSMAALGSGLSGNFVWTRGILGSNGKIYGMPNQGNRVIEIDPVSQTVSQFTAMASAFACGATLTPSGTIFGFDCNGTTGYVTIDPSAGTSTLHSAAVSPAISGWSSSLAPNGKIYNTTSLGTLFEFDPLTGTQGSVAGADYSEGGVMALNGKIYYAPYNVNRVMVLDTHAKGTFPSGLILSPYVNGSH